MRGEAIKQSKSFLEMSAIAKKSFLKHRAQCYSGENISCALMLKDAYQLAQSVEGFVVAFDSSNQAKGAQKEITDPNDALIQSQEERAYAKDCPKINTYQCAEKIVEESLKLLKNKISKKQKITAATTDSRELLKESLLFLQKKRTSSSYSGFLQKFKSEKQELLKALNEEEEKLIAVSTLEKEKESPKKEADFVYAEKEEEAIDKSKEAVPSSITSKKNNSTKRSLNLFERARRRLRADIDRFKGHRIKHLAQAEMIRRELARRKAARKKALKQ